MAEKIEFVVEAIVKEFIKQLGVKADFKIIKDKEGLLIVLLETKEPGILIGFHGQTINAIQLLVSLMTYRKTGEWARILIDVNDYRQKRKEALERMALSVAQKVKFSGESQALPAMSSFERRIVHMALADDGEIETFSEGEKEERKVVVRPRDEAGKEEAGVGNEEKGSV